MKGCNLIEVYVRFGEDYYLNLQGRRVTSKHHTYFIVTTAGTTGLMKVKLSLSFKLSTNTLKRMVEGVELWLHAFITALEGDEWSASRPGYFIDVLLLLDARF
jgi:hypothetical protein